MGNYATTSSLSQLLPNALAGQTTTSDTEGTATFSKHIDRAEADINAVLAEKYSLPFTSVPPSLRSWTEDLSCYYFLRAAVSQDARAGDGSAAKFQPAYDRLIKAQENGFKGVLALTDGTYMPRKTNTMFLSTTKDFSPTFGLDNPEKWDVDKDLTDELDTLRDT